MEVGFNSPSRKRVHFTSTSTKGKGNKAKGRKAQERGERNHINIIDEVDYHVGAFPHPFRGHEVACRLLQPLWGRQRPTARSYSHTAWRHSPARGKNSWEQKATRGRRRRTPSTIGETDDDVTASSVAT
eukprot:scaffold4884_cov122-Isochrysis_galbana.AAC.2